MSLHQPILEDEPDFNPPTEKTELQKTAFDRIIVAIHDFVLFLRDLYVPADAILVPPEGGWPVITKESWSSFGKSDEVIEVLRHLTYIKSYFTGDRYEFLPDSGLFDYRRPKTVKDVTMGNGREVAMFTENPGEPAPCYVVGLIGGGRACQTVLLDCRNGIVYGEGTFELGWSEGVKRPVEEYFAILKDRFKQMQLLPCGIYQVSEEGHEFDTVFRPLKEIFKRHGWPDNYRREQCLAELEEFGQPANIVRLQHEYLQSLTPTDHGVSERP